MEKQAIVKYSILTISFFVILASIFFGIKYWKEQSEATKINALIEHFKSGGDVLCQLVDDNSLILLNYKNARYNTDGKFEIEIYKDRTQAPCDETKLPTDGRDYTKLSGAELVNYMNCLGNAAPNIPDIETFLPENCRIKK